jgi:hypothetical protein
MTQKAQNRMVGFWRGGRIRVEVVVVGKLVMIGPLKTQKTLKSEEWVGLFQYAYSESADHQIL